MSLIVTNTVQRTSLEAIQFLHPQLQIFVYCHVKLHGNTACVTFPFGLQLLEIHNGHLMI